MNFVLAAGGTGGHMVPAHALAAELRKRGHGVLLITDDRGSRFPGLFNGVPVHILPAGRLRKSPLGLIACLAIACLYLTIVARVLIKLLEEESTFAILAAAGLTIQFGLQALINMAVNVQIAPSKGMTLPFISYGGSSMLALSIGMGLLLAFTRRNPYLTRSPDVVKWSGEQLTT